MTIYKLTQSAAVIRDNNTSFIAGCGNAEDLAYQAWLLAGNIPLAADPPPPTAEWIIAVDGGKQWFLDNPATMQLFTLTIPELETEINILVDALFPAATQANRSKTKKFWMALAISVRVLVRRELE